MNLVTLIGRLTRDPELRYVANTGNAMTRFTLAVDRNLAKDKKQEAESKGQPTADFIGIVVWGKQAESCANYLTKGRLVAVNGRIQTGSYEGQDGQRRYTTDVVATEVKFLEYGDRSTAATQGYADDGAAKAATPQDFQQQTLASATDPFPF